jgi:hypothetical protein
VDRLVLLGDVLELRQAPVREVLAAGEAPLRELGAALAPGAQVVIVPGNHDHLLLAAWMQRRARRGAPAPLGLQSAVDWRAAEPLARLARWFEPAQLEVAYPGTWLRDDVYAIHGHYGDRHTTVPMLERLAAGVMARIAGQVPGGPDTAEAYEAILGPIYAWVDAVAQSGGRRLGRGSQGASAHAWRVLSGSGRRRGWRRRAAALAFPGLIAGLNRAGLGPLKADLSTPGLRSAGLRAADESLLSLGVVARHVIFGHTHRAGPLPGDDRGEWRTLGGAHLVNSGCWVHEPGFLGPEPDRSPYRAGFCVALDGHGPPVLTNLLDGLGVR